MRRSLIALATVTLLAGAGSARAGEYDPVPGYAPGYGVPAYGAPAYGAPGYGWQDQDHWERRRAWREMRRQQDEARIQEAARREAMRIEAERESRRAWWRAQREQQGYGYGYGYDRHW